MRCICKERCFSEFFSTQNFDYEKEPERVLLSLPSKKEGGEFFIGGIVEEKKIVATKRKRKLKSWGDEGFSTKISYGCFDYEVKFLPEEKIKILIGANDGSNIYGAIDQFEQLVYIASDTTPQCQKATLLHELVHAIFLMNGSMSVGSSKEDVLEQMNVASELLVDRTANGIFEIMRRNPELMRWLLK